MNNWQQEFEETFDKIFKGCGVGYGKNQAGLKNFITTLLEKQRDEICEMIEKKKEKANKYKLKYDKWHESYNFFRGQEEICDDIINLIKSHDKKS